MGLTPKQEEAMRAFRSGKFKYFCLAGTTGSGKTIFSLGILHFLCSRIPNLRFAVIRKSEKNLKQTSIPSYKTMMRLTKSETNSTITNLIAKYKNGSEILFIWADISKDPDLDNIKGLELTGALIEEANQVDKKYFDLLKTRIGRCSNDKCPAFIMINLNPSQGWVKETFYDAYSEGTLKEDYFFIQFNINDINIVDKKTTEAFLNNLEDLPPEEYQRFVLNDWNYADIPNQLIRFEWYKNCCIDEYFIKKTDKGSLALDPAGEGADNTVLARMHGDHIGWWEEYPNLDSGQSGILAMERAKENMIDNRDVIVDGIGEGSGAITSMRMNKFFPRIFKASHSADWMDGLLSCLNARSESHWMLREAMRKEEITITHNARFQKECTKTTYSANDRVIKILSKEELKKPQNIGWSPGMLDCASMLMYHNVTNGRATQSGLVKDQLNRMVNMNSLSRVELDRRKRVQNQLVGV